MKALIVCDMVQDFVTGVIGNPRSQAIIPNIEQLLEKARGDRGAWLTVYVNDAHLPHDFELKVWGEHSMAGSPGAEIIPQLKQQEEDFVRVCTSSGGRVSSGGGTAS